MQVTKTPSGYEVEFQYNPTIVKEIKTISGSRWNSIRKSWFLPLSSSDDINRLMKRYGINEIAERREEFGAIPELPELEDDQLEIAKKLWVPTDKHPFPYQLKGVAYNIKNKRVIVGDQPGLGKTVQAILTAAITGRKCVLVVCPASLKENWKREFKTYVGWEAMILADRVKNTWQSYYKAGMVKVFITNYESLKKYFVDRFTNEEGQRLTLKHIRFKESISLFDMVICDELHRCKDGATQQAKFVMGIAKGKEYVLGLTGTPVVNKPKDLIAQLHIIQRLMDLGGYKFFMKRYCGGNGSGATNLKELNYRISLNCFYQRQKKEVLAELPDKIRHIVLCDITTLREYNEALKSLAEYLTKWRNKTDDEVERSLRGEIMVQIGVCKNISARGKMNEVVEHIDEVIDSGEKIIVFIHQKEICSQLLHHYPNAVTVRGDDSMEARQRSVDAFQNNPNVKIIICSIKAAGVGLTLTASSRVAFVELPWHPADCDQCEDRCHRIGQKNSVQATYFLGKDTIDERIYKMIESKREIANTITGTVDNIQREFIDKLADSLFNSDNK